MPSFTIVNSSRGIQKIPQNLLVVKSLTRPPTFHSKSVYHMRRGRNWKSATTPLPKLRVVDRSPLVTLRNSIIENPQFDHLSFETLLELRESLREHAETLRNFRFFERAKRVNLIERKLDKKIQEECESLHDYGSSPAKPMRRPKEALMRRQHEQILADFEGVWATEMYAKFHKGEDPEREEAEYEANYAQARENLMQRFAAEMSAFDAPEKPFVVLNVNKPVKRPVVTPSIARFAQISRGKDRIVQPEIMRKTLPLAEEKLRFTSTEVFVPHSPRNILDEKEDEENVRWIMLT